MKLINGILRPGTVVEVGEFGVVKVEAQGLFSKEEDPSKLPPVYPFVDIIGNHSNTFSTPIVGDNVWVLNLTDNPLQLYWFRRDSIKTNNPIFQEAGTENVEIICNRNASNGWASLFFSDGTGWIIRNDSSFIQIDKNGNIISHSVGNTDMSADGNVNITSNADASFKSNGKLDINIGSPMRGITLDSGAVHIGVGGMEQPAVLGNNLLQVLTAIGTTLTATAAVCTTPYLSPLKPSLDAGGQAVTSLANLILSQNVKIS